VFGDPAPSIKQDQRKRDQVREAVAWMIRHDLAPSGIAAS
jgi:hypothetical protein